MADSQTNVGRDLLLDLGQPADGPLHERMTRALRGAIREGRLDDGQVLPPSRDLAADLGCSRWAVTQAYGQLVAEGYLEARTGSGTRVRSAGHRDDVGHRAAAGRTQPPARYDLAPGLPDLRAFPRTRWTDALRTASADATVAELGHPPQEGHAGLRTLLAARARRTRGAVADADAVTVCTSVTDAVRRICRALAARGDVAIGCEDPGWTRLREVIRSAGLTPVPIPVDDDGIRVDLLRRHPRLRAVLVTPAHQFPRGVVLAAQRRAELVAWARDVDGVVLEDDYDAEFRYDRKPVGAMQGLDPARVILLSSLSKTVSPALGIGWIVAPPAWTARLRSPTSARSRHRRSTSSRSRR